MTQPSFLYNGNSFIWNAGIWIETGLWPGGGAYVEKLSCYLVGQGSTLRVVRLSNPT